MKVQQKQLNGKVIRDTEVYIVEDNSYLKNLTLSKTTLRPGKSTSGHSHSGLEEVYFFNEGMGRMQLDKEIFEVKPNDIVLIPDGAFHKVFNDTGEKTDLIFTCVFQAYQREN